MPARVLRSVVWLWLSLGACTAACSVVFPQTTQDDHMAGMVRNALLDSRRLNLSRIDVSVEDGVCYLSGEASSGESKIEAEALAGRIPGIRQVVNKLEVQP